MNIAELLVFIVYLVAMIGIGVHFFGSSRKVVGLRERR